MNISISERTATRPNRTVAVSRRPWYLQAFSSLGILIFSQAFPAAFSFYNMIIIRTFMEQLPRFL